MIIVFCGKLSEKESNFIFPFLLIFIEVINMSISIVDYKDDKKQWLDNHPGKDFETISCHWGAKLISIHSVFLAVLVVSTLAFWYGEYAKKIAFVFCYFGITLLTGIARLTLVLMHPSQPKSDVSSDVYCKLYYAWNPTTEWIGIVLSLLYGSVAVFAVLGASVHICFGKKTSNNEERLV